MRDYITEANKFMYDDSYIVETKVKVDGKTFASKDAAEADLKKKGLTNKQIEAKLDKAIVAANYAGNAARKLADKYRKSGDKKKAKFHDDEANKHWDKFNELIQKRKDHQDETGKASTLSDEKINMHLENAKKIHEYHTKGGGKNEDWAHNKHDYFHDEHKDIIDRIEKRKKQNKKVPHHLVKELDRFNKAGMKAYKEIEFS